MCVFFIKYRIYAFCFIYIAYTCVCVSNIGLFNGSYLLTQKSRLKSPSKFKRQIKKYKCGIVVWELGVSEIKKKNKEKYTYKNNTTEKKIYIYMCVCVCILLSLYLSLPISLSPYLSLSLSRSLLDLFQTCFRYKQNLIKHSLIFCIKLN